MTLGPLEYTVIGFEGNRFDGSIADELQRVIARLRELDEPVPLQFENYR
jgi:uncharacterized protein YajQ (UPF0234 family)